MGREKDELQKWDLAALLVDIYEMQLSEKMRYNIKDQITVQWTYAIVTRGWRFFTNQTRYCNGMFILTERQNKHNA